MRTQTAHTSLVLSGLLPSGPQSNCVEFLRDEQRIAFVRNEGDQSLPFQVELGLDDSAQTNRFVARVEHGFSPWRRGLSNDTRELGFALFSAELASEAPRCRSLRPLRLATTARSPISTERLPIFYSECSGLSSVLRRLQRVSARPQPVAARRFARRHHSGTWQRNNACRLPCGAGNRVGEGFDSHRGGCCDQWLETAPITPKLIARYPGFRFMFVSRPLGFTAAVRTGLRHVTAGWTYLLNNDVLAGRGRSV